VNGLALSAAGLSAPDYAGAHLGRVVPAALDAVGVSIPGRDFALDRSLIGLPRARHVVVVLLDGLGHFQLDARRGHAPFLRGAESAVISAGFPTTTATSLALLGTGRAAGLTGMTGYTARNPRTGELANLISWEGADPPQEWQREPVLLAAAAEAGVAVTAIGKARFAGSGLTQAVLRAGEFRPAARLSDGVDAALRLAREPGMTYLYFSEIDAAGHARGWQSEEWAAALEDADTALKRLATDLPAGAVMMVTADHGMVDVPGAPRWDVAHDAALGAGIETVAGEPRALHLHTTVGAADAVASRWQERLGGSAVVGTREQWIAEGVFGPVAEHVLERIGDVVVAMTGRATVVDSRTQSPESIALVGMHGSLTPEELLVPLLTIGR
jgi:hypothetical protein